MIVEKKDLELLVYCVHERINIIENDMRNYEDGVLIDMEIATPLIKELSQLKQLLKKLEAHPEA